MSPQADPGTTRSDIERPAHAVAASLAAGTIAFVAYFALLHWLIVGDFASRAGAAFAPWLALAMIAAPWVLAAGSLSRRAAALGVAVAVAAVLAAVLVAGSAATSTDGPLRSAARAAAAIAAHVDALLFVENGVFLIALCVVFARSLRGPGEALVTRLARAVRRGDMPPAVVRYTRAVTLAWATFFAAAAVVSALLFATQSKAAWSAFVNLLLWPLTAAMFALEYAVRVRVLRDVSHAPVAAGIDAGIDAFRRRDRPRPVASAADAAIDTATGTRTR